MDTKTAIYFLYPSIPFQLGTIEETFLAESEAIREVGFGISTLSIEDLEQRNLKIRPSIPVSSMVVYRGWMLNAEAYKCLEQSILSKGCKLLTNFETYLSCHHIPNWYPRISDLTPQTRFFTVKDNLEVELRSLGWSSFFIKDYVKSLKTSVGSLISDPTAIAKVLSEMEKYRGNIEGGISVREGEPIIQASEQRYFVVDGKVYGDTKQPPKIALECAQRIESRFFSIDVAEREDGILRVIEIGDGQVSDTVGWSPKRFAEVLKDAWC